MKKPKEVLDAERAVQVGTDMLKSAEASLDVARKTLADLHRALHDALIRADEAMPHHCTMKTSSRFSKAENSHRVVIVRKTTSGKLIVRQIGNDLEIVFAWNKFHGAFEEKRKRGSWHTSFSTLSDVPAEFLPKEDA